jgi:mannose-6-phosphate isomerase-like protein (cupin superfamily)
MLKGEVEITVGDEVKVAKSGEAIRYRGDLPHKIRNTGTVDAHAHMILMLRQLSPSN